jgi:hypothetical protein
MFSATSIQVTRAFVVTFPPNLPRAARLPLLPDLMQSRH